MTKRNPLIKVVKRNQEPAVEKTLTAEEIRLNEEQERIDDHREMTDTVKSWIAERRENKTAEDLDSAGHRSGWDTKPDAA